tara:strand:- start:237 stop:494 length:258 start_codon:yes stop_codon:yes gene_type:complete
MKTKEQKLPKWFNGTIYKKGEIVINRFSGEEYELNNIELSMYDLIMGATILIEMNMVTDEILDDHRKGLYWFRTYSPKAYMVLLD